MVTGFTIRVLPGITKLPLIVSSLGGKGGGGRADFAQAGGTEISKIDDAFDKIKSLI